MSKATPNLPDDYVPFAELIICGNYLINGYIPFQVSDKIPLLVGKDTVALVWLSAPASKDGKIWRDIVTKNKSLIETITVVLSPENDLITISAGVTTLLQAKKLADNKAEIISLNLRPLGLNVYGDSSGLYIGTNLLSNNTFHNVHTMIAIG